MSYTHYADTLVTLMLGWIRALTDWIWNMIRLGDSSAGAAFLSWFTDNWLIAVLFLLIAGVAADWLIWLVRWKPYWLWFGKKRRILEDVDEPEPVRDKRTAAKKPVRRKPAAPSDEDDELSFDAPAKPRVPRYRSDALPRRKETRPVREQADEDDLFDVVSPVLTERQQARRAALSAEDGVDPYLANRSQDQPKERNKPDELNWFDS